jgi:hypothetical protein
MLIGNIASICNLVNACAVENAIDVKKWKIPYRNEPRKSTSVTVTIHTKPFLKKTQ